MKCFLLWLFCVFFMGGCAVLNAPVCHSRDLSSYHTFYVPNQDGDKLELAPIITQSLQKAGIKTQTGFLPKTNTPGCAIIRYHYETLHEGAFHLKKLVLRVIDTHTGKTFSLSLSCQEPSLLPDTNEEIDVKAVRNLLAATPGPKSHARGSLMERETLLW